MSDAVYNPAFEDDSACSWWTPERARAATIVSIAAGLMVIGAVMTF